MGSDSTPLHILHSPRHKGIQNVRTAQPLWTSEPSVLQLKSHISNTVLTSSQIVRVGPYELSFVSEVAEKDIYSSHRSSSGRQLSKYKFTPPARISGIFNNPSDADHSRLRKILSVAFSDKALREREPFLQDYITLFIRQLKELPVGKKVDLVWWLDCIGFDTIAHLTFGESFHALYVNLIN
jgi:hypothetical protein